MALSATQLATELQGLGLYDTESAAIAAWADAFANYFGDAQSNAVIIVPGAVTVAKAAMVSALTGLSTDSGLALQTGITAFWGALVPAVAWPTTTAITPPTFLGTIKATLDPVFLANTNGALSKNASYTAIANALHPLQLGGTALWPSPLFAQPIL
jgi:hypothetical protein